MSHMKRVSLTTIESNNEKAKTKRKGSLRINIPIVEEPTSKEYSRFSYETLFKSALDRKRQKKDTNGGVHNGLPNGCGEGEDDGDEDELVKLAKKFEQKYGGTQKKDNYSELGAGYDEEDSFIDNTDAYNDELSEDLLPKHGGYYLNRGNLVLERVDIPEEVIENEDICRNKIKRTINAIQSSDEEDAGESSEAEESGGEEDEDEDEEDEEEESQGREKKRTEENGLGSKPANIASIADTIESVIGKQTDSSKTHAHRNEVGIIKKKKKRKREGEEEEEEGKSKQRKQDDKPIEANHTSPSKQHKHLKKHKDRQHPEGKEHVKYSQDNKEHVKYSQDNKEHVKYSQDNKEHKKKGGGTTVKELLNERKANETVCPTPQSTPNSAWTPLSSSNLSDVIESVVRAAHWHPQSLYTPPNPADLNPCVTSEDSVSLPTSEDIDMSDKEQNQSEVTPLLNGHKDDGAHLPAGSSLTHSTPSDLKIPETLSEEIRNLIGRLKQVAGQVPNLSTRKSFPPEVNVLLIELEANCRSISSANKNAVYAHIGSFLPVSKDTLIKRARKMSVDREEEKLDAILNALKVKIESVMPGVLLQYYKDCEQATKKMIAEKAVETGSSEQKPQEKVHMPRKVFPWDLELRSSVHSVIEIKENCFRILKCRKETEEEYVKEYLDTKVKPLWPDGWMRTHVLYKEGKSTSSMRSRKYTPKPASKQQAVVTPQPRLLDTPPPTTASKVQPSQPSKLQGQNSLAKSQLPKPQPMPLPAKDSMFFSPEPQSLLSSLTAGNSYQTTPSPVPTSAPASTSLFSKIQASLAASAPIITAPSVPASTTSFPFNSPVTSNSPSISSNSTSQAKPPATNTLVNSPALNSPLSASNSTSQAKPPATNTLVSSPTLNSPLSASNSTSQAKPPATNTLVSSLALNSPLSASNSAKSSSKVQSSSSSMNTESVLATTSNSNAYSTSPVNNANKNGSKNASNGSNPLANSFSVPNTKQLTSVSSNKISNVSNIPTISNSKNISSNVTTNSKTSSNVATMSSPSATMASSFAKKSPTSPSPTPHSISNLMNTSTPHVSSNKYNLSSIGMSPGLLTPGKGSSFPIPSDLLPVSTSLSSLISSAGYLSSLAYGLPTTAGSKTTLPPAGKFSSAGDKDKNPSHSLYKPPPYSQPPNLPFSHPQSTPSLARGKSPVSALPSQSAPKQLSSPNLAMQETTGSGKILDLSPGASACGLPLSSKDQSVSPVSSKSSPSSMLSLKQRILADNAKPFMPMSFNVLNNNKVSTSSPSYVSKESRPTPPTSSLVTPTSSMIGGSTVSSSSKPTSSPVIGGQTSLFSSISGKTTPSPVIGGQTTPFSSISGKTIPSPVIGGQTTPFSSISGKTIPSPVIGGQTSLFSSISGKTTPSSVISGQTSPFSSISCKTTPSPVIGGQTAPFSSISGKPSSVIGGQTTSSSLLSGKTTPVIGGNSLLPPPITTPRHDSSPFSNIAPSKSPFSAHSISSFSGVVAKSEVGAGARVDHSVKAIVSTSSGGYQTGPVSNVTSTLQSQDLGQRRASRSSSKDSDGKESEIVADVLKSLMSLNQMSENSGSPDKTKVFHQDMKGGSNQTSGGVPKIHMGFEDEFKRHLKRAGPAPGTPGATSEFTMRLPTGVSTPTAHVSQGNCLLESMASQSNLMPPSQTASRPSTTCSTFKPRCHYTDS